MLAAAMAAVALTLFVGRNADAQGFAPPSLGGPAAPGTAPLRGPPVTPVQPPAIAEIGQSADGAVTYLATGYAPSSAGAASLGGTAYGEFNIRFGGFCLDSALATLTPSGVSANSTAWSYDVTAVSVALVEDAPKGSCKYTVRVNYAVSLTGAVTLNQVQYTLFLKGHAVTAGLAASPSSGRPTGGATRVATPEKRRHEQDARSTGRQTMAAADDAASPPKTFIYHRHSALVIATHWINFACIVLLLMSGMAIFNAHPALYWGAQSDFANPLLNLASRRRR